MVDQDQAGASSSRLIENYCLTLFFSFLGLFLEVDSRIVPRASFINIILLQNGPLHISPDYSIVPNNYSWNRQADTFWLDQPGMKLVVDSV